MFFMRKFQKLKVFVGMSGGVDSSVAAWLLKRRGYDVIGVFIRGFNIDGCAERDVEDARRAAAKIGIPFYVFNFEKEYKKKVVDYMINGYKKGITPNPDVMCNREIKFGLFLKKALTLGADYVATGHYVRLKYLYLKNKASYILYSARDENKDQSYFLWALTQKELKHCLFPIGDYLKSEVRTIARKAGLPTAEKKDSQGICFLGKVSLIDFLKQYIKPKKGLIVTPDNQKIGEHEGVYFYTVGQRHLKISNFKSQNPNQKPFYVVSKNVKNNTLIVAEGDDNPALFKKEVILTNVNFINQRHFNFLKNMKVWRVLTRIRYRQPLVLAEIKFKSSQNFKLIFDKPQKFVAPGQSAVFYSNKKELLGGGVIR